MSKGIGTMKKYWIWKVILPTLLCVEMTYGCFQESLVELRIIGGIAGFRRYLVIYQNGLAYVDLGKEKVWKYLKENKLIEIRRALENLDFKHLKPEYIPSQPIYDGFAYNLTYHGFTVRLQDPIEDVAPKDLCDVVKMLQGILECFRVNKKNCNYFRRG